MLSYSNEKITNLNLNEFSCSINYEENSVKSVKKANHINFIKTLTTSEYNKLTS